MKKNKLLPFLLLATLTACQDKEDEPILEDIIAECDDSNEFRLSALYANKHSIGVEQAQSDAMKVIDKLTSGENGLKSAKKRTISNVSVITAEKVGLKSHNLGGVDTLAYILNLSDSTGFAIVSADDRVYAPVIAYIEDGAYSSDNGLLMNYAVSYVRSSISDFEKKKAGRIKKYESGFYDKVSYNSLKASTLKQVGPYLFGVAARWGRGVPYNLGSCQVSGCNRDAVSNGYITGLSQIMAYWQYPKVFNWAFIHNPAYGSGNHYIQVNKLRKWIGDNSYTTYRCQQCGGSVSAGSWGGLRPLDINHLNKVYNDWLSGEGYKNEAVEYSVTTLKTFIERGPVLMMPVDDYRDIKYNNSWVADGYKEIGLPLPPNGAITSFTFFHYNWGMDGNNNGYFAAGNVNTLSPLSFDSANFSNQVNQSYTINNLHMYCATIYPR